MDGVAGESAGVSVVWGSSSGAQVPPSTPGSEAKQPAREAPAKEARAHARISQPNTVGTQDTSQPPRRAWHVYSYSSTREQASCLMARLPRRFL